MAIVIDAATVLILTVLGYAAVCCYLQNIKYTKINFEVLKIKSLNRWAFLICPVVVGGILIALFNTIYSNTIIHQVKTLSLVTLILPMAAVDYRKHVIPNAFIVAALIVRAAIFLAEYISLGNSVIYILIDDLIGAAVIAVFFLIIMFIFKNSIGMGDIKLFAVMGLYEGLWGAVNSVFFSLLACFVLSIVLLISKKKSRKDSIAFCPCILVGTAVAIALSGM